MAKIRVSKLNTYASLLKEIRKVDDEHKYVGVGLLFSEGKEEILDIGKLPRSCSVDVEFIDGILHLSFPDNIQVIEKWDARPDDVGSKKFTASQFPIKDIDTRIKQARDRLRYLKKR